MSDSCCCPSTIETRHLQRRQRRVLAIVLAVNLATFAMMVIGSVLSGSSALLSGTLDNLGDALTYGLSFAVVGATPLVKARVALFKGLLIMGAALAVAGHIGWRLMHMDAPAAGPMGLAAVLNLAANAACLALLTPLKDMDINMSSVWECSRNDVVEGFAVIAAALAVWLTRSGWPDVLVAVGLLALFARSATRVLRGAWRQMAPAGSSGQA